MHVLNKRKIKLVPLPSSQLGFYTNDCYACSAYFLAAVDALSSLFDALSSLFDALSSLFDALSSLFDALSSLFDGLSSLFDRDGGAGACGCFFRVGRRTRRAQPKLLSPPSADLDLEVARIGSRNLETRPWAERNAGRSGATRPGLFVALFRGLSVVGVYKSGEKLCAPFHFSFHLHVLPYSNRPAVARHLFVRRSGRDHLQDAQTEGRTEVVAILLDADGSLENPGCQLIKLVQKA